MRYIELQTSAHPQVDQLVLNALRALPEGSSEETVEAQVRIGTMVDYKELLRVIVQSPVRGQEAMSTEDMEAASDIVDKLDKLDSRTLVLENAEYKFLLAKVEATGWKYADPRFAKFVRDIRSAPTTPAEE